MPTKISFLFSGIIFGLSAGLSPGPLLTLVVSETLRFNTKEGIKVSIAPLITDLPIVLAIVFIISQLSDIHPILGAISLLGAIFLAYLGYGNIRFKGVEIDVEQIKPQSLKKGIIANILNPHPYLFWFTVGAPLTIKAAKVGFVSSVLFIIGFYLLLIGSKILVAIVIGKSRRFLTSKSYVYANKFLGILLLIFAILFVWDGLKYFGII